MTFVGKKVFSGGADGGSNRHSPAAGGLQGGERYVEVESNDSVDYSDDSFGDVVAGKEDVEVEKLIEETGLKAEFSALQMHMLIIAFVGRHSKNT